MSINPDENWKKGELIREEQFFFAQNSKNGYIQSINLCSSI